MGFRNGKEICEPLGTGPSQREIASVVRVWGDTVFSQKNGTKAPRGRSPHLTMTVLWMVTFWVPWPWKWTMIRARQWEQLRGRLVLMKRQVKMLWPRWDRPLRPEALPVALSQWIKLKTGWLRERSIQLPPKGYSWGNYVQQQSSAPAPKAKMTQTWLSHNFAAHQSPALCPPPPPPVPQLQFYALWDMSFTVRGDMHTASHACGLSGHLSWQVQRWNVQSVHHQHVRQWQPVVQVQKVDTLKAETSRYVSLHTCWPMKSHIHRRMKWVIEMYWSHTKWTTHGSWSVRAKFSCHIRSGSAVTLRMRCIVHHKSCTANVIPDNYWHALSLQPRHGPF